MTRPRCEKPQMENGSICALAHTYRGQCTRDNQSPTIWPLQEQNRTLPFEQFPKELPSATNIAVQCPPSFLCHYLSTPTLVPDAKINSHTWAKPGTHLLAKQLVPLGNLDPAMNVGVVREDTELGENYSKVHFYLGMWESYDLLTVVMNFRNNSRLESFCFQNLCC
jgi:hypothetical protein